MKNTIYVCGKSSLLRLVKETLPDHTIIPLMLDQLNNDNFKNNNTIFFGDRNLEKIIKKNFFLQNNALFFIRDNKDSFNQSKSKNPNFFYRRLTIKKFIDEVKTCFIVKKAVLKKIEIFGEKITNTKLNLNAMLTPLENEILIFLFENKRIKKEYFLERILKLKKETETKTAESHLSRIRGKLIRIKSEIQIKTKGDMFYLEY